jgi:hypothetical protein
MLVLSALVRDMGVRNRSMVVFVRVEGSEVLPFAYELVWSFATIVRYMRMVVVVYGGIVAVLDVLGEVRPLKNLVACTARGRKQARRLERQKAQETDGCSFSGGFFHDIHLFWLRLSSVV